MPGSRQVRRLIKRERDQLRKRLMLVEENSNVHIDEIRDHEEIEADQENLEVGQDNLELGEENLEVHENLDVDQENVLGGQDNVKVNQEDIENIESDQGDLNFKLKQWYIKHKPTRSCAIDLIKILNEENLNVRPFYKFKCRNTPDITEIDGGSYLHIGLSKQLVKLSVVAELPEVLSIDVYIDGLPLSKSSRAQLWPILVRVNNINKCPVFPVGVFSSKNKPYNCVQYMSKCTSELSDLFIIFFLLSFFFLLMHLQGHLLQEPLDIHPVTAVPNVFRLVAK